MVLLKILLSLAILLILLLRLMVELSYGIEVIMEYLMDVTLMGIVLVLHICSSFLSPLFPGMGFFINRPQPFIG